MKRLHSSMCTEELPHDRYRRLMVCVTKPRLTQELYFCRWILSLHFEPCRDIVFSAERKILGQSVCSQPVITSTSTLGTSRFTSPQPEKVPPQYGIVVSASP